jgi:hypothetical protein
VTRVQVTVQCDVTHLWSRHTIQIPHSDAEASHRVTLYFCSLCSDALPKLPLSLSRISPRHHHHGTCPKQGCINIAWRWAEAADAQRARENAPQYLHIEQRVAGKSLKQGCTGWSRRVALLGHSLRARNLCLELAQAG